MARSKALSEEKITEIEELLTKYNGIPSQYDDRKAYAAISYIFKTNSDNPRIASLIEKYGNQRRKIKFEDKLTEIQEIIEQHKGVPSSAEDNTLYTKVRRFFIDNGEREDVQKLMYQIAYNSVFPLKNTKYGSKPSSNWDSINGASREWLLWRRNVSFEYIEYCFEHFNMLPDETSKPMKEFKTVINHFFRYNVDCSQETQDALFSLSKRLIELGCRDILVEQLFYAFDFMKKEVQNRVRSLLIENGACTVFYISQMAIPGKNLSPEFVHYYYYCLHHDNDNFWGIYPLGNLTPVNYDCDDPKYSLLLCHYRDYEKCDINKIRERAKSLYRDWYYHPPQTLDEWRAYGNWGVFVSENGYDDSTCKRTCTTNWESTVIEEALTKGCPYFRYRKEIKYIDYYLFLAENGFPIDKEHEDFMKMQRFPQWEDGFGNTEAETLRKKLVEYLKYQ